MFNYSKNLDYFEAILSFAAAKWPTIFFISIEIVLRNMTVFGWDAKLNTRPKDKIYQVSRFTELLQDEKRISL